MGFLDGQKAIHYYDPSKCTICVSQNVTFNEDEEPHQVEIITDIPGLQLEGEHKLDKDNGKSQILKLTEPTRETETETTEKLAHHTYPPRATRNVD